MPDFLNTRLEVPCPVCGSKVSVTLGDIKRERILNCPAGHSIQLRDQGDGIQKVDRALDNFKRKIKRLGRR